MRCPECNTEIKDPTTRFCPECGTPLKEQSTESQDKKNNSNNEPQLSRGMMIFIFVGLLFLIFFGTYQYVTHRDDPEYFRTAIDPDSNLADKNTVKFDTVAPDTAKRDSIKKAEKREAEKILNSIRKKPAEESKSESSESGAESKSEETAPSTTETTAPAASEPAPISVPKPKVEQIENE